MRLGVGIFVSAEQILPIDSSCIVCYISFWFHPLAARTGLLASLEIRGDWPGVKIQEK
jgi:hypothetical protein